MVVSQETRLRMSKAQKERFKKYPHPRGNTGKKASKETKIKMSNSAKLNHARYWKDKHRDETTKSKISESYKEKYSNGYISPLKNRKQSEETKKKRSINMIGKNYGEQLCIHHINGNHFDNRQENLMIVTRSEHTKIHHRQGDIPYGRKNKLMEVK